MLFWVLCLLSSMKTFVAQTSISFFSMVENLHTVNYPKKTDFFKEQNADFSAKIHRVTLTKPGLLKKALYLRNLWINHPNFMHWYFGIYLQGLYIRNSIPTTRRTLRITSRWSLTRNVDYWNLIYLMNHHNFSVNLPIVFNYFYFVKKKSNHQVFIIQTI